VKGTQVRLLISSLVLLRDFRLRRMWWRSASTLCSELQTFLSREHPLFQSAWK